MPTLHVQHIPTPRGHGRVTERRDFARVGSHTVTLYAVRFYGLAARRGTTGAPEGQPGAVVGYGVTVEDADGCVAYTQEQRGEAESVAIFGKALAQLVRRFPSVPVLDASRRPRSEG